MKIRKIIQLFSFFLLFVISITFIATNITLVPTEDALSKYGSRGEEVKKIQRVLKNQGLYNGNIDGIFGKQTQNAVRTFQKNNGLAVDGIAGPKTLKAMGISSSSSSSSNREGDVYLLARIISAEARGEPYKGQVAVGAVVLNRVKSPSFPNTLSGVIYQKGAFTAITDGQFNQPISDSAYKAARDALNGWDPTNGCLYYYNPKKTSNKWMHSRPIITVIGNHRFCK
ncbi:MAG: spore cortex-lytic enzyme [Clostridia bacterium]|nr:spore cortex-lytic enzyme [Clostridia bacterium]